jgi:hypothetical protein
MSALKIRSRRRRSKEWHPQSLGTGLDPLVGRRLALGRQVKQTNGAGTRDLNQGGGKQCGRSRTTHLVGHQPNGLAVLHQLQCSIEKTLLSGLVHPLQSNGHTA